MVNADLKRAGRYGGVFDLAAAGNHQDNRYPGYRRYSIGSLFYLSYLPDAETYTGSGSAQGLDRLGLLDAAEPVAESARH